MQDPFPAVPAQLRALVEPLCAKLQLQTLPQHVHEVIGACAAYTLIFSILSPLLSRLLLRSTYTSLSPRTRLNWDVRVTSFVQSSFICAFALAVVWDDAERARMGWRERVWGYTPAGGAVQACAAGYFVWDLGVSLWYFEVLGVGSLAHAVSALLVTSLGFRPFANYYGLNFILYELSTPSLNIHWFLDKLNMTGSRLQLINGLVLITTFFGARVVWGNLQSYHIYSDLYKALYSSRGVSEIFKPSAANPFEEASLPTWLAILYLGSNTMLNVLNVYWFAKMVQALLKRFDGPKGAAAKLKDKDK